MATHIFLPPVRTRSLSKKYPSMVAPAAPTIPPFSKPYTRTRSSSNKSSLVDSVDITSFFEATNITEDQVCVHDLGDDDDCDTVQLERAEPKSPKSQIVVHERAIEAEYHDDDNTLASSPESIDIQASSTTDSICGDVDPLLSHYRDADP